ncbi:MULTISPECIES: hypothetical protein [unclassified Maridesulfovibrio]|uniref:hypothetical protein n=1 Tax=unclassified Maridesulfovibrio TaxID=2794999 RepID=UPI003B42787F
MTETVLKKLCLAKNQYHLGLNNIQIANDFSICTGVILLQDAIETFLISVSEHLNVDIKEKDNFNTYIDKINTSIHPEQLPYRQQLTRLNKMRVSAKHYGIFPNAREVDNILPAVSNFLFETTQTVLNSNFNSVDMTDALDNIEIKSCMTKASFYYENCKYGECLIECRKAIFLDIEKDYDISKFADDNIHKGLLALTQGPPITQKIKNILKTTFVTQLTI